MSISEEIKQRLDIVELIQTNGVQLRKAGRNFTGFCPFHPNSRTPAFYVFPHTQSYYCFSCHKAGDAFTFVMERQGLQFGDALAQLAQRAGVQLPELAPGMREAQEQENAVQAKLRQINEDAAVYWHHLLRNTAKGESGRAYVARRGLADATVETWQIGYAADDWSDLLRHLTDRKGHTPEELEQAGLIIRREQGGFYDRFRNRLMFPIRDLKGTIVGFGGRALGDDHAKYMNTPETPIFHKSHLLFGLHQARDGIRTSDSVVVVEGYLDVITTHQAGFTNVVAPMGTALTAEQVQILRRLTGNIFLALDADAAGIRAAEKGLTSILETSEPQLIVQGRKNALEADLKWAVDLDLNVNVIELPPGKDPDDIVRDDPDRWRALTQAALPIVEYFFEQYTRGLDLKKSTDRQRALELLSPIVASINNVAKRNVYETMLSEITQIPHSLILSTILEITRQQRSRTSKRSEHHRPAAPAPPPISVDPFAHEDELLSLLLRFPQIRSGVEATLAGELESFPDLRDDIPATLRDAFTRVENRLLWYAWSEHGESGPADVGVWLGSLDPALRPQADRLLQWQDRPPLRETALLAEERKQAKGIAERLRQTIAKRRRAEMTSLTRSVEDDETWNQLARKLQLVLDYSNVVTAPRRSTIFQDLGSRREEFG